MDKFKGSLFIFLCLAMLLCSSCIYATDVNENATVTDNLQVDETITDTPTIEKNTNDDIGSFDELDDIIQNLKPGEVYSIDKDYRFDDAGTTGRCISIGTDNITINGNGHYFDGNNNSVTFKITGNNVNILNLNFKNCQGYGETMTITIDGNPTIVYTTTMSPVYWKGANGTMSNCYLIGNSALNGGAVTWTGENGIINNTLFINNAAKGVGGAIYLNGENTTITNTIFINSTSRLFNEAIYLDRKHNSFNLDNIVCDHIFCINGSDVSIDSDNLRKSYTAQFAGETIDLIPIIYTSLFGMNSLDNQTFYYGQFSKETRTFTLVLIKTYDEYSVTYENEYVIPANSMDEIFDGLLSNFYSINTKIIKTVNVNTIEEYNAVCHSDVNNDIIKTSVMDIIRNDMKSNPKFKGITYMLNVNYKSNTVFISNEQWDENIGYDMIIVNGNGATVRAMAKEDDEYHWILNKHNKTFAVSNLTIEGFNTAIQNINGTCIFNYVRFNNNRLNYHISKDYGGAILNAGIISCTNCTFSNNYAKHGGAIFSQGLLILENCTFENNAGYGTGMDVLNVDKGIVIYKGEGNPIRYVKTISPLETAVSVAVAAIAIFATTAMAAFLAFVISGGNPVAALCAGLAIATVVGGGIIAICARDLNFRVHELDYDTKVELLNYTSNIVSMGIEAAIATISFIDSIKVYDETVPEFKMNAENELCVCIDGQYYEVGSEAVYIKNQWVKISDTVEIDGIYYSKENSEYLKNNEYSEKRINPGLKVEFENLDLIGTVKLTN